MKKGNILEFWGRMFSNCPNVFGQCLVAKNGVFLVYQKQDPEQLKKHQKL
jgi:hypothetical protein